jgi:hypothetical protein
MRRKVLRRIIFTAQVMFLSLIVCFTANAGTIVFNNFDTGGIYRIDAGWTVSNASPAAGVGSITVGHVFTPSLTGFVSDIWLAASLLYGSNSLDMALMSDSSGQPGSVLESWNFVDDMGPFGSWSSPLHAIGNGTTEIFSGNIYWLVASAPLEGTHAVWNVNSVGDFGPQAYTQNGGSWITGASPERGAFRVAVNPIPEPSALFLFGAGLMGIGILTKRFKH